MCLSRCCGASVRSRGAFIFDEDLLRTVHLLGLSYADAERLRKAFKRGGEATGPWANRLRAAALAGGWNDHEIDVILQWLTFIHWYTFTRGHALALAHCAWRVARLQAHYPAHFYAAVLDRLGEWGGGLSPRLVYVVEARRHGLEVVGPSINSPWQSQPCGRIIHTGLGILVGSIAQGTLEQIHREARLQPFVDLPDLLARVTIPPETLERLIAAGTLDDLASSRRSARWIAHLTRHRPRQQTTLLNDPQPPQMGQETVFERAAEEYHILGFTLSVDHPLALYSAALTGVDLVPTVRLPERVGRDVLCAGVVVTGRRIKTADGQPMAFLSICDTTASVR